MKTSLLIFTPPPPLLSSLKLPMLAASPSLHLIPRFPFLKSDLSRRFPPRRPDFTLRADDLDVDVGDSDEYDMNEDEEEEFDDKDYDVEYEPLAYGGAVGDDIEMVHSSSFLSTQETVSQTVVDYRINEDDFHKISFVDCDFFIRKPPDPDNDVYDFREMYVTPPDTDVYSIPTVLAPMPKKYIRCAKSDYGCYNVTEPPIDAPRGPLYKSEKDILKVYLIKHYRNRRFGDLDFVLDFEEIYVINSKTKSISRAKVLVTVPGGRNRDRKTDLLVVSDHGTSFKVIPEREREDATTVIEKKEWEKSREDMERHLRKFKDFSVSNWF